MNENALMKARQKLDMILTDRQKQEIIKKLENTDRRTLMEMIGKMDLSSLNSETMEKLFKNTDANEIMKKFNQM